MTFFVCISVCLYPNSPLDGQDRLYLCLRPGIIELLNAKGQIVNILEVASCVISVMTTPYSSCSAKAAKDDTQVNECVCCNKTLFIPTRGGLDLAHEL